MERIPKGLYTPEFRAEALKLVMNSGLSVDAATKRLSVPKSSLGNWVILPDHQLITTTVQAISIVDRNPELEAMTAVQVLARYFGRSADEALPTPTPSCPHLHPGKLLAELFPEGLLRSYIANFRCSVLHGAHGTILVFISSSTPSNLATGENNSTLMSCP